MRTIVAIFAIVFSVCACSPREHSYLDHGSKSEQLVGCYKIADSLVEQMTAKNNTPSSILRTDFINAYAPEANTIVGRLFSDAVASRLAQRGLQVIDPLPERQSIVKNTNNGETKQARDSTVSERYKSAATLVGHFKKVQSKESTTLFVKILDARTNAIIASEEYELED